MTQVRGRGSYPAGYGVGSRWDHASFETQSRNRIASTQEIYLLSTKFSLFPKSVFFLLSGLNPHAAKRWSEILPKKACRP